MNDNALLSSKESIHRSFAGAMISGLVSDLVFKGIHGTHSNFDLLDISLAAFQSGVSRVSYRAAIETIACLNKDFEKIQDDPKAVSQSIVYLTGGSLGALYATGINYPIDCIREFRNNRNKEFKMNFTDAEKFYADRVFYYVGYATSMGNIVPLLSKQKNNFKRHPRMQISHLKTILVGNPHKILNCNSEFMPCIKYYAKSFAVEIISSDLLSSFQKGIDRVKYLAL